jgi:DNA-binding IclR family transcriptional regulator/ABC-type sugar transport system substrate-binding protein
VAAGGGRRAAGGAPVKSADRSLALLELLAGRPEGVSFAEIARTLALPRSSAHGLLQTLLGRGYVEPIAPVAAPAGAAGAAGGAAGGGRERERHFRLGLKLAELGAASLRGRGRELLERARAAVGELAARSGAAARLAVLDGVEALYLHAEEGTSPSGGHPAGAHGVRLVSPVGQRLPAHATAEGKALLAGLPDAAVAARYAAAGMGPALPRLTGRTLDSLPQLLAELRAVRALGHAHDVDEHAEGLHCVAAPVVDGTGAHQAALSVAVPTPQLDAGRLVALAHLVQEVAGRLSAPRAPAARRAPAGGATVRVAWSMAQGGAPYFGEIGRAAERLAPALGVELIRSNAHRDHDRQECDVRHLLALRPGALVVHPVHTIRSDALFRLAAAAGVPSICFRRPARSDAYDLFAGGDTFQEGVLQIEWVAARLGGRGGVVLLEGDPYNDNARNIAAGNRHALSRHPGLRLVADAVCPDWSGAAAQRVAAEVLDAGGAGGGAGPLAVVCANDIMAGAVAETLAARGLTGRVLLVGGDGTRAAAAALQAGQLDATVFHNPARLAEETLRAAAGLARGALDLGAHPRRSPATNPPSRAMPVLDVPYQVVDREHAAGLAAFWAAVDSDTGAARPAGALAG